MVLKIEDNINEQYQYSPGEYHGYDYDVENKKRSTSIGLFPEYLEHMVLYHQNTDRDNDVSLSKMLVSAAGVGKTSFIKDLAKLVGLSVVIIEAPHLVEEKIINIPFIVKRPNSTVETKRKTKATIVPTTDNDVSNAANKPTTTNKPTRTPKSATKEIEEYDIELADSYLYSQLTSSKALTDEQYKANIYTDLNLVKIYESLGGTKDEIPPIIKRIRSMYKVILFIDEYFRTPSQAITALLRALLGRTVGMHKLPNYVYIAYASNEADVGGSIRKRMSNERFQTHTLLPPTKDEWFDWLLNHVKDNHPHIRLNMAIINKFHKLLKDEDISNDFVVEQSSKGDIIRTSPRRWEQLLLYINAAFPLDGNNEEEKKYDAMALLTNVHLNFLHYIEKISHPIANDVLTAIVKLVKELENIDITTNDLHSEDDWIHTFHQQVRLKKELGDTRKYVPVISGPPGVGKAQPKYSKIKTPIGWTTMGDIVVGDKITTPSGDIANVSAIFPQGIKDIYRVTFSDGRFTDVCNEHLWKIRKDRETNWEVVDTQEISRLLTTKSRWVYVPLISNNISDIDVPMDPYLLGCLLGDGGLTQSQIKFTNNDTELLENLSNLIEKDGYQLKYESKYDYRLQPIITNRNKPTATKGTSNNIFKQQLIDLGLCGTNSYTKFIPEVYKHASKQQKECLIAGLFDTDGYANKVGAISISTSSKQLAEDIQYIIRSIGGIAIIKLRHPKYTYKGKQYDGAINYNISIRYSTPKQLSKLTRKLDRISDNYQYANLNLRVKSVEYIGKHDAQCIMVNHPDHLYITDDYIVTHNTANAFSTAKKLNLRLILVDCSVITDPGEVIGMPIRRNGPKGESQVRFAEPSLYKQIYQDIALEDLQYKKSLANDPDGEEKYKEYQNARWKYLIFFDELSVAPPAVINALRKVILEKSFGDTDESGKELKLPKEAIIIGAINPTGKQTKELTHHMRDVLDIIPSDASWNKQVQLLRSRDIEGVGEDVVDSVIDAMEQFINKFGDKESPIDKRAYNIEVEGLGSVYITPNHLSDVFATATTKVQRILDAVRTSRGTFKADIKGSALQHVWGDIREAIYWSYQPLLKDACKTADILESDIMSWLRSVHSWFHGSNTSIGDKLIHQSGSERTSVDAILQEHLLEKNKHHLHEDQRFVNYLESGNKSEVEIGHELKEWFIETFNKFDDKDKIKYFVTCSVPMMGLDPDDDTKLRQHTSKEDGKEVNDKITPALNLVLQMGLTTVIHGLSGELTSIIRELTNTPIDDLVNEMHEKKIITDDQYENEWSINNEVAYYIEHLRGNINHPKPEDDEE